jgi:PAS domain S-box-containing protein
MSKTIKTREKSLEETSNQLLMAFEASNEGLYDLDLSTNDVLFSPTWYEMLGYEPYEIPSTVETVNELIHPEDRELVRKAEVEYMTQKKDRLTLEFRLRTKSGVYKWIASRGKTVEFDSNGRAKRLMGAHIDITELKEAQKKIQALSRQILSAQEIERQKIARELHDNIAQNLSSLKILLQTLFTREADLSVATKYKAKYITEIIQLCIKDVSNMSYDLCPPEIDQLGLVKAVAKFCEDFSKREKTKIDFSALGVNEDLLDRETNINLYRITQEALNNIKNHAEATSVTIKLISSFPEIILRIEDDGKGFNVKSRKTAALSEKRMGLENMKERVRLLRGEIRFQAKKNKGTIILVKIPYKGEKE